MKGASKVKGQLKSVKKGTDDVTKATKKNTTATKKGTQADKKAADQKKKLGFIQKRLTASYLAGNIAARSISFAVSKLAQTMAFGVKSAVDFEFTMTKISAISGVTGASLESLENTIRNIAKVSPKTGAQVAQAALEMSKMGLAGKDLEDSLEGVVGLSVALDEEVSTVGQTMVSIKNVFQKDASELTNIADKMFTTLGNSALNLEKFSTAFSFAGSSARLAGVSFEEMSALMGVLADNGIKASTIGTQLRQIFTRLDDPTSKVSKAIGEQSLKTKGLSGTLKELVPLLNNSGDAKAFFGQRAIAVADILVNNISAIEDLTNKTEAMTKSTSTAADMMGDTMFGAAKKVESAFGDLWISMSKVFSPVAKFGLEQIAALLNGLVDPINKASSDLEDFELMGGQFHNKKASNENQKSFMELAAERFQKELANEKEIARLKLEESTKIALFEKKEAEKRAKEAAKEAKIREDTIKRIRTFGPFSPTGKFTPKLLTVDGSASSAPRAGDGDSKEEKEARKEGERLRRKDLAVEQFAAKALEGQAKELADLTATKDSILAMEGITNEQRLQIEESFQQKKQEIQRRFAVENALAIGSEVVNLANSFNALGQVQTANAVKRAQSEGASEEQINAIRKKGFEQQKKYMYLNAIMSTASGVARAFSDYPFPVSAVIAGLVGTAGLVQAATISQQQFASGFEGRVNQPTNILVGEEGPEDVMIKPRAKTGGSSGGGDTIIHLNVAGDINGEEQFIQRVRSAEQEISRRSM